MTPRHILIVSLWLRNNDITAFEEFERRAVKLLERHGGRIDQVIRPLKAPDADTPFEVHVVSFASAQGFADYRADADVQKLATERDRIISRTTILEGSEVCGYS